MKPELADKAVERFLSGYNCAESVLLTGCEMLGIESEITPKIATGFGGGIGRQGSVCGALSGAVMALGLKLGRMKAEDTESRERTYAASLQLYKEFEKEFGSAICYELIGCDLTNPEQRKRFHEMNVAKEKCAKFVHKATSILVDLVSRQQ